MSKETHEKFVVLTDGSPLYNKIVQEVCLHLGMSLPGRSNREHDNEVTQNAVAISVNMTINKYDWVTTLGWFKSTSGVLPPTKSIVEFMEWANERVPMRVGLLTIKLREDGLFEIGDTVVSFKAVRKIVDNFNRIWSK